MKKPLLVFLIGLLAASGPDLAVSAPIIRPLPNGAAFSAAPKDSLGVEKKDGKVFVLHRIGQGQTLYSLVRRYKTSIQAIKDANPGLGDNVQYDQTIRVPVTLARREEKKIEKAIRKEEKERKREEKEAAKAPDDVKSRSDRENPNVGIHQVEAGQTVYSLAAKYGISTADLRKWNNLTSDHIESGQALIVTERAWREREPSVPNKSSVQAAKPTTKPSDSPKTERPSPPRTVARNEVPKVDSPKTETPRPDVGRPELGRPELGRSDVGRSEPNRSEPAREEASRPAESAPTAAEARVIRPGDTNPALNPGTKARRIADIGFAEVIDESDNSSKYLALHRTAPVGTLVLVRNDRNNQSIWVKVIGRLPDTSVNDKVIVKISARAFEKLSPVDRRFRAEVSYLAQ